MAELAFERVAWRRQTRAFAQRHLQQLSRNKMILFLTIGWPVLWYFLTMNFFVELPAGTDLGALKAVNGINYGLFGAFTVTVALFSGGFARDLESNRYQKLRTMPISPTADLAGRFTAGTLLGFASYIVTVTVAYLDGAAFPSLDASTVAVLGVTLVMFCLIAMALAMVLALVVTKPEHMATIAIVTVLLAYIITGFNGTTPGMLANSADVVNYLPNSLATRMQIGFWLDTANLEYMTPPAVPTSTTDIALLVGYATLLLTISVVVMQRFAYGSE